MPGIAAIVFDAYGTLFDVHSAIARHAARVGPEADAVSRLWRLKQLEYSWTLSLMGRFEPFWTLTGRALDHALAAHGIGDPALRQDLMDAYLTLSPYPEAVEVVRLLRKAGRKTAILSNGSTEMLQAAVLAAKLDQAMDAVLSVDGLKVYKPYPKVYQLAVDALGVEPGAIAFVSSNRWDAAGAASFGFQVRWVNRASAVDEYGWLPNPPRMIGNLAELPDLSGL